MKAHDNGCFFSVSCSARDVEDFAAQWPCFGPTRAMWFQFDKSNGDLVDLTGDSESNDGHGVSCLADDAKAYGARKFGLDL